MPRFLELLLIVLVLPLLVPLGLLVALLVRLRLGHPVLYRQPRGGLHGQRFDIVKFRSMTDERDCNGELLPDSVRLNRFGKFLRATSLDELPCFWNVLKGDMALVGPRPFIADYLDLYTPHQMRRHDVRPGITGWAQVNGRNTLSWEEKFELDLWYVEHRTLWLDLRILLLTALKVFARHGVNAADDVTMPRFTGSNRHSKTEQPDL
jgi:lipopolysaccharide/colanic/teichoic acid biosynthesis glycosyltransferase